MKLDVKLNVKLDWCETLNSLVDVKLSSGTSASSSSTSDAWNVEDATLELTNKFWLIKKSTSSAKTATKAKTEIKRRATRFLNPSIALQLLKIITKGQLLPDSSWRSLLLRSVTEMREQWLTGRATLTLPTADCSRQYSNTKVQKDNKTERQKDKKTKRQKDKKYKNTTIQSKRKARFSSLLHQTC